MSLLGEKLLAVDAALEAFPHAFGGAIALAYCTLQPRGTRDIDINVFVGLEQVDAVLRAMPHGVTVRAVDRTRAKRDGQVRVWWDETPLDIFFAVHDFHAAIGKETKVVAFEGAKIRVLSCDALIVFKAMFNRAKDWADIEAVVKAEMIDGERVVEQLQSLLGASDPAVVRLRAFVEG